MTTISKFYLHDAATPNTGTMPGSGDAFNAFFSGSGDVTGDATGARTARDATDVIGAGQTSATFTSNADTNQQQWGLRRFVSRPLAAQTLPTGSWTFSAASAESNLNHNQACRAGVSLWRPGTGFVQVSAWVLLGLAEPASAGVETAASITAGQGAIPTVLDGDVLVFEIQDVFTQAMGTAYTSTFYYDGTTEASATNCASFVTPPAPITLYTPPVGSLLAPGSRDGRKGALPMRILRAMAVDLDRKWSKNNSGLLVPA